MPVAGPSTTQARPTQLPQATSDLLAGLAGAHSIHFPRLAVHPDTSEISTAAQRQDAEQKIALLKSVLSGWMQGVEMDLERGTGSCHSWLLTLVRLTLLRLQTSPQRWRTSAPSLQPFLAPSAESRQSPASSFTPPARLPHRPHAFRPLPLSSTGRQSRDTSLRSHRRFNQS